MKIVDEPAERVESELGAREIEVRREPYDPRSRNLLSDFIGFLRSPRPGSTVTLFEDDRGRVRYYTVTRPDPEVAALREQVAELTRSDAEPLPAVALARIEKRLDILDELQEKAAKVDELAARVERLPELEAKVAQLPELQEKVAKLPALESRLGEITQLKTRLDRLER